MLLAIHMIGTSEALAMGEAIGLDPAVLSEIMKASSGNNWSLQVYNPWPDVMEGVPSSNQLSTRFYGRSDGQGSGLGLRGGRELRS